MEQQNLERGGERDAPQSHHESLSRQEATALFESLLLRLGAATQADAVQLFCARVPYRTMIDWRRGRHRVPQWAWDYLATMLEARADADKAMAARGRKAPAMAPGQGSHRNIVAWNKRRATLAAKKKEAGA